MLSLEKQNEWRNIYQQAHPSWRPATEQFAAMVQSRINSDALILDLGCGRGGLVEQLEVVENQVVGIDADWDSLVNHRLSGFVCLDDGIPGRAHLV